MKYLKMFETSIPHIPVKYNYSYVYFDGGTPYDHYAKSNWITIFIWAKQGSI